MLCCAAALGAAGCGGQDQVTAAPHAGRITAVDEPSGARIALPRPARPRADYTDSSVTSRNYTTTAAGGAVEVGFNVLDTQGRDHDFEVRVRVAATVQGRVVSAETIDVDGYAAVDVEMALAAATS